MHNCGTLRHFLHWTRVVDTLEWHAFTSLRQLLMDALNMLLIHRSFNQP